MNYFEDFEKIIERAKTKPKKTIIILIVLLIFAFAIAYGKAFFSAMAINHAKPSIPAQSEKSESCTTLIKQAGSEKANNTAIIEQETKGSQSPAIVTNKDVKIIYKGSK